ncbi:MAG TPA: L-threonylcarbamoyladenylate synthase [bacterium]|nr:L-threonylcarbamoyladenylate synthase [bacterium]
MPARILTPGPDLAHDPAIAEAAALLRAGELVAFPTETVYGLGADATNPAAVERLYAVKGRPADNPSIVHVGTNEAILRVGVVDGRAVALLKRFWPGSLTMVIPSIEPVRSAMGRGLETVAVRMPGHPVALALLHAAGIPVAAPSANRSGRPSPTTAQHVFDDLGDAISLILDGGPCAVGIESTVVDLTTIPARVLRPGLISAADIGEVLGEAVLDGPDIEGRSPGTRHPHYRPQVPVVLLERDAPDSTWRAAAAPFAGRPLGVIASRERELGIDPTQAHWRIARHAEALTRNLYAYLRELDALGVAGILVEGVDPREPVMERLRRAAQT